MLYLLTHSFKQSTRQKKIWSRSEARARIPVYRLVTLTFPPDLHIPSPHKAVHTTCFSPQKSKLSHHFPDPVNARHTRAGKSSEKMSRRILFSFCVCGDGRVHVRGWGEEGGTQGAGTFYRGIRDLECSVFITGDGLVNFDVGRVYKRSVRKCFVAG